MDAIIDRFGTNITIYACDQYGFRVVETIGVGIRGRNANRDRDQSVDDVANLCRYHCFYVFDGRRNYLGQIEFNDVPELLYEVFGSIL